MKQGVVIFLLSSVTEFAVYGHVPSCGAVNIVEEGGVCKQVVCSYQYHFVSDQMNWTGAQNYCNENFCDLATVLTPEDMDALMNTTNGNGGYMWTALYGAPNHWQLSHISTSLSGLSDNSWDFAKPINNNITNEYCVWIMRGLNLWYLSVCRYRAPFVCRSGDCIKQRHIFQVQLKTASSLTVNTSDAILQQWKVALASQGITGVSLMWRTQPDGEIFRLKAKDEMN